MARLPRFPESVPVGEAGNPHIRKGIACWRALAGDRPWPAPADLTLRGMASVLPYSVIIAAVEGDYQFRFVGDAQRAAYGISFKGLRVSQVEVASPHLGALVRAAYDKVREGGAPLLIRGRIDHVPVDPLMSYHETVFLPLGLDSVDHILTIGVQAPRPFWLMSPDKVAELASRAQTA